MNRFDLFALIGLIWFCSSIRVIYHCQVFFFKKLLRSPGKFKRGIRKRILLTTITYLNIPQISWAKTISTWFPRIVSHEGLEFDDVDPRGANPPG